MTLSERLTQILDLSLLLTTPGKPLDGEALSLLADLGRAAREAREEMERAAPAQSPAAGEGSDPIDCAINSLDKAIAIAYELLMGEKFPPGGIPTRTKSSPGIDLP